MARIVVSEFMDAAALARLAARHDVHYDPRLVDDPARLTEEAAACDALIVRNRTQVRGALLEALAPRCRLVGRLGAGLDNIDVERCAALGIGVIAAGGANARAVAEYVIAAALLLLRGVFGSTSAVVEGRWPRQALSSGREAGGKTLGLIGFGATGQCTARLGRGLGMRVIAFDAQRGAADPAYVELATQPVTLEEAIRGADVVSLHLPLTEATRGLIDASRIAAMKPGAILINVARGGIVDEQAVAQALRSGHLGGAAFDVFVEEPLRMAAHWQGCPNLLLTPHIAGLSAEANERVSALIAERVLEALKCG